MNGFARAVLPGRAATLYFVPMTFLRPLAAAFIAVTVVAPSSATGADAPVVRHSFAEPSYSPDGREIAFASAGDIWSVPAAGGDAHLL
ncbi:MAG: hypothetical protein ACREMU_00645, partial [Gemmatimonadaceae bacterium]